MKTILAVMAALSVAAPVAAQSNPAVSLRGFFLVAEEQFAAKSTFDAAFSSSLGTFLGGGGQAVFRDGVYVDLSASRFQKTGQRAFFNGGQSFRLGTPLTASLTPVEASVGYRFGLRRHRMVVPFVAAGVGQYRYKESSPNSDPGEDFSASHVGYLANAGVEVRLHEWIGVSVGAEYTHIPGIFGTGGVSQSAGDSDLGGYAGQIKLIVGR